MTFDLTTDPRFDEVVSYLRAVGADQGLTTPFAVHGNLVHLRM